MQKTGKEKDWVLFPYDPNHEMSVKDKCKNFIVTFVFHNYF